MLTLLIVSISYYLPASNMEAYSVSCLLLPFTFLSGLLPALSPPDAVESTRVVDKVRAAVVVRLPKIGRAGLLPRGLATTGERLRAAAADGTRNHGPRIAFAVFNSTGKR